MIFSNLNPNSSNLLHLRNVQEQVKEAFCYQKLFWPFTVWINCSSDLKIFVNSRPSALNFKRFSQSVEHFFLTVGQNNFGNKIPLFISLRGHVHYILPSCKVWFWRNRVSHVSIGGRDLPSCPQSSLFKSEWPLGTYSI